MNEEAYRDGSGTDLWIGSDWIWYLELRMRSTNVWDMTPLELPVPHLPLLFHALISLLILSLDHPGMHPLSQSCITWAASILELVRFFTHCLPHLTPRSPSRLLDHWWRGLDRTSNHSSQWGVINKSWYGDILFLFFLFLTLDCSRQPCRSLTRSPHC
jgi:hypothetical protein